MRNTKQKFPKPTNSPRGLLNEYGCGCQVRRDASGGHFIHACKLHNAAPVLYEALKAILDPVGGPARAVPVGKFAVWDRARAALALVDSPTTEEAQQ